MEEDEEVNRWIEAQYAIEQALEQDAQKLEARGIAPVSGRPLGKAPIKSERESASLVNVLLERHATHGNYSDQARVCQHLKTIVLTNNGQHGNSLSPVQLDALEMICVKISRILSGDPNHKDSWVDIAGYATLAADRCESP